MSHAELGGKLVFAIDVAKVDMVADFAAAASCVLQTIFWKAPEQNPNVLSILRDGHDEWLVARRFDST